MHEFFRDPVGILKEAVKGFMGDDGMGMAAEAAYRLVFALPPLVIFFASISAIASEYTGVDAFDRLLDRAQEGLPEEVFGTLELVLQSIEEQSGYGLLSFGLILALWSGSNAINAIVKAINRAHSLEDTRNFAVQRALSLGLTLGLSLLMISSFVLLVFGEGLGNEFANLFGMGELFTLIWNIIRWPVLLIMFMLALAMLYRFAPAETVLRKAIIPGVIIATLLWLASSYAFNIYLSFADPGNAYGVLGGILVLLLFLYISSIVIILGGEINAVVLHRMQGQGIASSSERKEPSINQVRHPLDVFPEPIESPIANISGKAATWAVLGVLVGGAIFGGLFRRNSGDGPPTL
jgi:membrane protein